MEEVQAPNGNDVFDDDLWWDLYIYREPFDETPMSVGQLSATIGCSLVSCCLSIAGSICIILAVRRKLHNVHNRLMMGLSAADIIVSLGLANMSWALPKSAGTIFALGNTTTCNVVGFMFIFVMASASYSTCISLYFLFSVRFRYRRQDFSYVEPVFHAVSWIPPLGIAIRAVMRGAINTPQLGAICTISTGPPDCRQFINEVGFKPKCLRGGETTVPLGGTLISFLTLSALAGICSTVLLFFSIRRNVMRSRRYSFRGRRLSVGTERVYRESLQQSSLYVASFVNSFFWLGFSTLLIEFLPYKSIRQQGKPFLFTVQLLSSIFVPLQGAFNAAVYFNPRVRNWKLLAPEENLWWCFRQVILDIEVPGGSSRSSRLSSFVSRESTQRRNRSQEGFRLGSVASFKTWNSKEEVGLEGVQREEFDTEAQNDEGELADTSRGATFVGDEDLTLRDVSLSSAVENMNDETTKPHEDEDSEKAVRPCIGFPSGEETASYCGGASNT